MRSKLQFGLIIVGFLALYKGFYYVNIDIFKNKTIDDFGVYLAVRSWREE